jgi:CHAT domain-containing protein/tetratricopeptide (TPR) repeat protein
MAQTWTTLNDEGMREYKAGHYRQAETYFERAVKTAHRKHQPGNELVALVNLGHAQQVVANYDAAHETFRKTLRIAINLHPRVHFDQIEAALNLSNSFLPEGKYDSCEHYALIAEEWIKQAIQQNSQHYREEIFRFFDASIKLQNMLASLSYQKGQYRKSIALMEQQQRYIRQMYPDNYDALPAYHTTLNNLSSYYMITGDYSAAKRVVIEDLSLFDAGSRNSLAYLHSLNNLGSVYRNLGQYDSAVIIFRAGEAMINAGHFRNSDIHLAIIINLGDILFLLEDYSGAIAAFEETIRSQEERGGLNPRIYQTSLLNLAEAQHWSGNFKAAEAAFRKLTSEVSQEIVHDFTYLSDAEKISFSRSNTGIVETFSSFAFELTGKLNLGVNKDGYTSNTGLCDLYDLLLITKGLILHPSLRIKSSILNGNNGELKLRYLDWEAKKYEYAHKARQEHIDKNELATILHEVEAQEKWLRSHSRDFENGFVVPRRTWQEVQRSLNPDEAAVEIVRLTNGLVYGAMILTSETKDGPAVALVKSKYPKLLERQHYKNYTNSIQHGTLDSLSYDVFWKPIEDTIQKYASHGTSIKRIYISADGVYHKINLQTLFNPNKKRYLIEDRDIVLITNSQEIIQRPTNTGVDTKDATLFGRPEYFPAGGKVKRILKDLPGSEREVDQIDSILRRAGWKTNRFKFIHATESNVKGQATRILHFATHGFVAQDTLHNDIHSIMVNTGIAMAGAGIENFREDEDGILTAYELMNLDLSHTQLVVMSACETGLGEFHSGEGVYGLQRALRSAGAKSVIMSLWKVDDEATQKLMVEFYSNWMGGESDLRTAFRRAQLSLMTMYPGPRYWGAFVLSGQ